MSDIYDEKENNTGAYTVAGGIGGAALANGAHRLANRKGYQEHAENKEARKNSGKDYKAADEHKLKKAIKRSGKYFDEIESIHAEFDSSTIDTLAENATSAEQLADTIHHNDSVKAVAEQRLTSTGHTIGADGRVSHTDPKSSAKIEGINPNHADFHELVDVAKEHAHASNNVEQARNVAFSDHGVSLSASAEDAVNALDSKANGYKAEHATSSAARAENITKRAHEKFGDQAPKMLESHRLTKVQVENGTNLSLGEELRTKGSVVKNAANPGNAVKRARNAVHNLGQDVRAGASDRLNEVRNRSWQARSGKASPVDFREFNYRPEYNPHEITTGKDVVHEGRLRTTAELTGEYKPVKKSAYKPTKINRPAGGLRSAIAGLAFGAVAGHVIGKVQSATHAEGPQQFDPYAAQQMAGFPVAPPYDTPMPMDPNQPVMGNYTAQYAAQQQAAELGQDNQNQI